MQGRIYTGNLVKEDFRFDYVATVGVVDSVMEKISSKISEICDCEEVHVKKITTS